MTLAYLATPYNHEQRSVMENRKLAAVSAAGRLLAAEKHVFCPIAHNSAILEVVALQTGWGVWAAFDKDMLGRCDELIVLKLDGWMLSQGIECEVEEAERLGLAIRCLDPSELHEYTPWFHGRTKPIRRGWYECRDPECPYEHTQFDWWNGSAWCKKPGARAYPRRKQNDFEWRGLSAPVSGAAVLVSRERT